jgi:hypothetical protein
LCGFIVCANETKAAPALGLIGGVLNCTKCGKVQTSADAGKEGREERQGIRGVPVSLANCTSVRMKANQAGIVDTKFDTEGLKNLI